VDVFSQDRCQRTFIRLRKTWYDGFKCYNDLSAQECRQFWLMAEVLITVTTNSKFLKLLIEPAPSFNWSHGW